MQPSTVKRRTDMEGVLGWLHDSKLLSLGIRKTGDFTDLVLLFEDVSKPAQRYELVAEQTVFLQINFDLASKRLVGDAVAELEIATIGERELLAAGVDLRTVHGITANRRLSLLLVPPAGTLVAIATHISIEPMS